jgi:hypothetical protein
VTDRIDFTNTLQAVTATEQAAAKSQWTIGDAIVKDLKAAGLVKTSPNAESALEDVSYKTIEQCVEQLEAKGFDKYSTSYCTKLYRTAHAFPRNDRNLEIGWEAHYEAGTPSNLAEASTALRRLKKSITGPNMRWLMGEWREKADAERKEANQGAKAKKATAKKKKADAAARKLAAKDKAAREQAEQDRQQAQAEADAADEQIKKTASAPSYNADVATELQDKGTLEVMAVHLGITVHLREIEKRTRTALKELEDIAEHVTPAMVAEISAATTKITDLIEEIKATVGLHKQARYQSIKGGVA